MERGIAWTCWNLFLATLPVIVGLKIGRAPPGRPRALTALLLAFWLLMLPNTAYLMTEWRHFLFDDHFVNLRDHGQEDRAAMYETAIWGLLFAGYAAFGALFFTLAVRPVEGLFRRQGWPLVVFAPILFLLVALGVYVGLFDRLNSWDVLRNPGLVVGCCGSVVSRPAALAAIVGFATVLWVAYVLIGWGLDGMAAAFARLRARRRSTSTSDASTKIDTRSDPANRA